MITIIVRIQVISEDFIDKSDYEWCSMTATISEKRNCLRRIHATWSIHKNRVIINQNYFQYKLAKIYT